MARQTDRLNRLEKELKPATKVVVCWCDIPKGEQHKQDCPAIKPEPNTMVVRVRYTRKPPPIGGNIPKISTRIE